MLQVSRGDAFLLDDVFLPSNNTAIAPSSSLELSRKGPHGSRAGAGVGAGASISMHDNAATETEDGRRAKSRYTGQLKSCQMRHTILVSFKLHL